MVVNKHTKTCQCFIWPQICKQELKSFKVEDFKRFHLKILFFLFLLNIISKALDENACLKQDLLWEEKHIRGTFKCFTRFTRIHKCLNQLSYFRKQVTKNYTYFNSDQLALIQHLEIFAIIRTQSNTQKFNLLWWELKVILFQR